MVSTTAPSAITRLLIQEISEVMSIIIGWLNLACSRVSSVNSASQPKADLKIIEKVTQKLMLNVVPVTRNLQPERIFSAIELFMWSTGYRSNFGRKLPWTRRAFSPVPFVAKHTLIRKMPSATLVHTWLKNSSVPYVKRSV
uniref:(northern house mosquito) hypothetical protein n=1 Tax=Culex pipiens TaxID=7175 RepID=A0A8D8N110_CULPI